MTAIKDALTDEDAAWLLRHIARETGAVMSTSDREALINIAQWLEVRAEGEEES
jgi:hypothetical protein